MLLALESSCDETAAAVIDRQRHILSNVALGGDLAGIEMRFDVIDRQQGNIQHQREGLRRGQTDQQRPDQPGVCGDSDGTDVIQCHPGLPERLVDDWQNPFDVRA